MDSAGESRDALSYTKALKSDILPCRFTPTITPTNPS